MERMLVVMFDSEDKAYKAAKVLERLKDLSLIALNADAIVTRTLGVKQPSPIHMPPIRRQRYVGRPSAA
jgi:uncharacterized membrane protein